MLKASEDASQCLTAGPATCEGGQLLTSPHHLVDTQRKPCCPEQLPVSGRQECLYLGARVAAHGADVIPVHCSSWRRER